MLDASETERATKKPRAESAPTRMLKPVFFFDSYRDYLQYIIDAKSDTRGFRSRLAEAAACQPSYLSQVLSGSGSFSLDQLFGISAYLQQTDEEWEYLRELAIADRAGSPKLKVDCRRRMAEFRKKRGGAAAVLPGQLTLTDEDLAWYVSS